MRGTIRTLAMVAATAAVVTTSGQPAQAGDEVEALRCQGRVAHKAASLLNCASGCARRAAGRPADEALLARFECEDRCVERYDRAVDQLGCESDLSDMPAADWSGMEADALRCHGSLTKVEGQLFNCHAGCAGRGAQAAAAGVPYDVQAECDAACLDRYEERTARVLERPYCAGVE